MALESGTYINSLNASNPASTDGLGQADDHIRLLKSTIKNTFPNIDAPVTATEDHLNLISSYTGNANDLNLLSGQSGAGLSSTELGYLTNVTSDIQAQINAISVAASGNLSTTDFAAANSGTGYGSLAYDNSGNYTFSRVTDSNIRGAFSAGANIAIDANGVISGSSASFSAGSGISISGTTISNSAPDQTVNLTGSGATSVSGTYPNFTISSTDTNTAYTAGGGIIISGTTISATFNYSLGAITSYAWLGKSSYGTITAGTTYYGSSLRYAGSVSTSIYSDDTAMDIGGASPSGTWRAMGEADVTSGRYPATLFLRIA
jgi:hypothetical protein